MAFDQPLPPRPPLEVLSEPWIQWCVLLPREVDSPRYEEIRRVAGPGLDALGMETGLSHMDWFQRPTGRWRSPKWARGRRGAQFVTLISTRTTSTSIGPGRA